MTNHNIRLFAAILLAATSPLAQAGQSTFGHARARELAAMGALPTSNDVVIRDIINYRRHNLPLPTASQAVALDIRFDPGGASRDGDFWLQVGYTTQPKGDRTLAPPCAVSLVIDCSGSMQARGKMSQVRSGLRALVDRLRPDDQVAVIAFSTEASVVTAMRPRGDGNWLQQCLSQLQPSASTNLHAGLMLGIEQLRNAELGQLSQRVILLTDGIANVGETNPNTIATEAKQRARGSIDISTIGVGDNLDTALLSSLANTNSGLFHLVANEQDVQKVFVNESDSLLAPAARHVTLQIDLPRSLHAIHAIGYEAELDGAIQTSEEDRSGRETRLSIRLPNLNAGATGVVMLRGRMRPQHATPRTPAERSMTAAAQVSFQRPGAQQRETVRATCQLQPAAEQAQAPRDLEVLRNAAIAVLADGIAAMAYKCDARRWADADLALQRALDDARRIFPSKDDDVGRVRSIANHHAATLKRYRNRFRSF